MQTRTGVGIACALAAASIYGFIPNLARLGFQNGVPGVEATLGAHHRHRPGAWAASSSSAAKASDCRAAPGRVSCCSRSPPPSSRSAICGASSIFRSALRSSSSSPFRSSSCLPRRSSKAIGPGLIRVLIACVAFAGLAIAVGASIDTIHWGGLALAASFGGRCHLAVLLRPLDLALSAAGGVRQSRPYRHLAGDPGGRLVVGRRAACDIHSGRRELGRLCRGPGPWCCLCGGLFRADAVACAMRPPRSSRPISISNRW